MLMCVGIFVYMCRPGL